MSLKNRSTMLVASSVLWQNIKCVILENLFTTTKLESLPLFELGKHIIKFIDISTQGSLGTFKEVYKPWGKTLDLVCLKVMHL
jgi:hypothetical protein